MRSTRKGCEFFFKGNVPIKCWLSVPCVGTCWTWDLPVYFRAVHECGFVGIVTDPSVFTNCTSHFKYTNIQPVFGRAATDNS